MAAEHPDRLIEMIALWYAEAGKYNVLPVDGRGQQRFADERPQLAPDRERYTYYPGTQEVPPNAAPKLLNRPHSAHVGVVIPDEGAEGVLLSQGGVDGGFTLFVQDGKLRYTYNYVADQHFHIVSDSDVPSGKHILSFEFAPTGPAEPLQGQGHAGHDHPLRRWRARGLWRAAGDRCPSPSGLAGGVSVGLDAGAPVTPEYAPPFAFTGTLIRAVYDVSGEPVVDHEAEIRIALARQ